MEHLINIDKRLFYAINGTRSEFLDWFFAVVSSHLFFGIVVVLFFVYLSLTRFRKRWWVCVVLIAVCFALSDRISVMCFKDVFERLRPSHALEGVFLVKLKGTELIYDSKGGLYGFVSSHAANAFCLSTVFTMLAKKRKTTGAISLLWASVTAYSRIYCGVHYPADVFCGALLGVALGIVIYYTYAFIVRKTEYGIPENKT